MPKNLPFLPLSFWKEIAPLNIATKAEKIFEILLSDDFSASQIKTIVSHAFSFDAPLKTLNQNIDVLELFHGPTLAFKDFGAQTMAMMLSLMAREQGETVTILTATSGDTGAAVANGFYDVPGVEVFILYPRKKVTPLQEKQFTTLGKNITALEINGTFDDCQHLVKACFSDQILRNKKQLTTANSINIARLLPQMIYYIHGTSALFFGNSQGEAQLFKNADSRAGMPSGREIVCSVPSGNFGNLTAGIMAYKMGLPLHRLLAATNLNHVVPDYLLGGSFEPKPSVRTLSNAMDVGNPSNFERMLYLYNNNHQEMAKDIKGAWYDDDQTESAIVRVWNDYGYLMDPHTAVGYLACRDHLRDSQKGIVLATAHPAKFPEVIEKVLPGVLETPDQLKTLIDKEKKSIAVNPRLEEVTEIIISSKR